MRISKRIDHSTPLFFKRTIAAQTHFLTSLAAIIGLCFLLPMTRNSTPIHFWGVLIFGLTAILVFTVSAVYHFIHDGFEISTELENFMERLDLYSIFLFIAGTYTPFLLNLVKSPWKETLMVLVWVMALFGIVYSAIKHRLPSWAQSRVVSTLVYVVMGWTLLIRVGEIWQNVPQTTALFFLAGSGAYTIGAVVYSTQKPKFNHKYFGFHELWHLLVTVGFMFHFAMVASFYTSN